MRLTISSSRWADSPPATPPARHRTDENLSRHTNSETPAYSDIRCHSYTPGMAGKGFESRTGYCREKPRISRADAGFNCFERRSHLSRSTRHSTRQHETGSASTTRLLASLALIFLVGVWLEQAEHARGATPASCQALRSEQARTRCIIRAVFHNEPDAAISVAWCESRLDVNARNGEYRGLFQMGARERARYGHGRTVLAQARAARRYYDHRGWTPWACKP